jgi:hypothetical protein
MPLPNASSCASRNPIRRVRVDEWIPGPLSFKTSGRIVVPARYKNPPAVIHSSRSSAQGVVERAMAVAVPAKAATAVTSWAKMACWVVYPARTKVQKSPRVVVCCDRCRVNVWERTNSKLLQHQ